MTIDEARLIFKEKFPNREIVKVTETEKFFLIAGKRNNTPVSKLSSLMPFDDGLKAVDKKTKDIFTYNPIRDGE